MDVDGSDALFAGGNDAAVLDFISSWPSPQPCPVRAIHVHNWQETAAWLRRMERA